MDNSGEHLNISNLIQQFRVIDTLHRKIRMNFTESTYEIVRAFYPTGLYSGVLNEAITDYANHIISATDSVIDKDKNYPEYRLKEELDRMQSLREKRFQQNKLLPFFEKLHNNTKKIMLHYFPSIIDLSGDGFRLLEINAHIYGITFERDLQSIIDQNHPSFNN